MIFRGVRVGMLRALLLSDGEIEDDGAELFRGKVAWKSEGRREGDALCRIKMVGRDWAWSGFGCSGPALMVVGFDLGRGPLAW